MRQKLLLLGVIAVVIGLGVVSPLSRLVDAKTGETKLLVVLALDPDPAALVAPDALLQAARTIEQRAQALAGENAEVWTSGETRIVVELPGFGESDHDRVANLLTSNALLELIDPQGEFLPSGTIVVTNLGGPVDGATPSAVTVYTTIISGSDVSLATKDADQFGQPTVRFKLTDEAAARFFAYTSEHLNLPLSIVIDKTVISSPVINAPISGDGLIAGLTEDEVDNLVLQFNTGELAVPLKVESSLLLDGLPGEDDVTSEAVATPVAVSGCWTADQVVSTDQLQWSVPPGFTLDTTKRYTATVTTNLGTFTIALLTGDAPITVNNFVCLARTGYFDGSPFHRILAEFVIQGGDPTGTGRGSPGYRFDDEPIRRDYELGTVAMANAGPNTNGSQFFVVVGPQGQQLPKQYTIFGQVSEGMDVVQRIADVPVDLNERGELSDPIDPVMVESITISES